MLEFTKPLPKYQCHKVVGALTIKSIKPVQKARFVTLWEMEFEEEGYGPICMEASWVNKHNPKIGGKLVQYDDNYVSYSPPKQFSEGYKLIEQTEKPKGPDNVVTHEGLASVK